MVKSLVFMNKAIVYSTVDGVPCMVVWCHIYRIQGSGFHIGVGVPLGFEILLWFRMTTPKGSEAAAH